MTQKKACSVRRGQEERQNARAQCNELTLVKLMELMSQWEFDIDALSLAPGHRLLSVSPDSCVSSFRKH